MTEDDQKIPEEVWAQEMAEENYNPNEEEDYCQTDEQKATKKRKMEEKEKKDKEKKRRQESPQQPPKVATPLTPPQQPVQGLEVTAPQTPEQPEEEEEAKVEALIPQPPAEAQPVNGQVLDGFRDQWRQEWQLLAEHIGQPIDELEPGFPQYNHFLNHPLPDQQNLQLADELGKAEAIVAPAPDLPLFPLLEKSAKKEMGIPFQMNPRFIRHEYEDWSEERQLEFLGELRRALPQVVPPRQQNEELLNDERQNKEPKINKIGPPFVFDGPEMPAEGDDAEEEQEAVPWVFDEGRADEESMKEDAYIARRLREEEEEYGEIVRHEEYKKKKPRDRSNQLSALMKRGLQKHSEANEMRNIRNLLDGKSIEKTQTKPFYGRANIEDLNVDEMTLLFEKFTFQGQLTLLLVCPQWQQMEISTLQKQTYLWFSNEEKHSKRFLPIEVCCETCRHKIDSEPVIRVVRNVYLIQVIDKILCLTKKLKCLRLYRFELNRPLIVRKLHKSCPQLIHLDLTECYDLRLHVITELGETFPGMNHLLMSSTNLDEQMLSHLLKKMKSLQTLDVSATLIDGSSLDLLPKGLKRLDIRCCPNITNQILLDAVRQMQIKELEHLKIDAILSRDLFDTIGRTQTSLLVLEVNQFNEIVVSANDFMEPIRQLHRLQSLKFGRNIAVNSQLLQSLLDFCKDIRSFSIEFGDYGERSLIDRDFESIAKKWPLLERLEIINCPAAEKQLSNAIELMANLNYLNLTQCVRLADDFFAKTIKRVSSNLTYIVLDNCHNLGKGTLDAAIIKAQRMTYEILRVSMLRCNLPNLPYLKSKLLPKNLRISFSSTNAKTFTTFDGQTTRVGKMAQLIHYLRDN